MVRQVFLQPNLTHHWIYIYSHLVSHIYRQAVQMSAKYPFFMVTCSFSAFCILLEDLKKPFLLLHLSKKVLERIIAIRTSFPVKGENRLIHNLYPQLLLIKKYFSRRSPGKITRNIALTFYLNIFITFVIELIRGICSPDFFMKLWAACDSLIF